MTLVELLVASAFSLVVLTLMTSMIGAFSKSETSTVNSANSAAAVRVVLLQLQHDIQSANPLGTLSAVADYDDQLKLTVQPTSTVVTWRYDFTASTLSRQAGTAAPVVELTGVTNGDPSSGGVPVFSYFDHCTINQVTAPQATPASISAATTVVQVTVSVRNLNAAPYGTTTKVNIMNRAPGASRCG